MHYSNPEVFYDVPMGTGENPLWHPLEQVLYCLDIPNRVLHRFDPKSGKHRDYKLESEPGALAWCAGGGLVLALRHGIARLDTDSGKVRMLLDAPYDPALMRFNDGRCDAHGRFWIGTLYEPRDQQKAAMYCLDRGKLRCVWMESTTVSNGIAFSQDQKIFYHSDTTSHTIWQRDYDGERGQVGPARVFKCYSKEKDEHYVGRPDGAVVDAENSYWCAMFEGARLLRYSQDGKMLAEISLPLRCPTMPCFGGKDLQTIYITSASRGRSDAEREKFPISGCVLQLQVEVSGLPEPAYVE